MSRGAPRDERWLLLALAAQAAIAAVDWASGGDVLITVAYLLPPLALASVATPRQVVISAGLMLALATARGWLVDTSTRNDAIRIGLVAIAAALLVTASRSRVRTQQLASELAWTQARLDGMLNALAEAVTVHDRRGKTVYANQAAAELLGAESVEEVLRAEPGQLGARFVISHEDGTPVAIDEFPGRRLMLGEDAPPVLTLSVHRASGSARWLLTKATLLRDESGEPLAVNVIEDVTEAKEAELRQRFLAEAGQLLASSLDYERTLERVAQLAVPWLADWCSVQLPDEHGVLRTVALAHADPAKVELGREIDRRWPVDMDEETGAPAIMRGGPAELYREIPDELLAQSITDPERLEALRDLGMRSLMLIPMRVGEETLGVITFVSAESGRAFDEDDFAFAQDLALRAATAVQNARLYAEQVRLAHTLQASLLPERLPEIPGWESGAAYRPGERGAEVGGDFYDIVATPRGHLVFLGDVTGKGVRAAALTSQVRHSARMAARFDSSPAAVVALVDAVLTEQPELAPVTLVAALVENERVTVCAAGHPLPLLKPSAGSAREVGRYGVLLGIPGDHDWDETELTLDPGDTLLLYTDGVTDTPGAGERFGLGRLLAVVDAAPAEPPLLIAEIETALGAFQESEASDDRALLVLRFVGERDPLGDAAPNAAATAAD